MKKRTVLAFGFSLLTVILATFSAFAQTPGGSLTIGLSIEPITLDPAGGLYIPEQFLIQQIYDSLIYADQDLNYAPGLATEWSVNEAGTEFTFKLRQDVKFHDGTAFNANAVKVSFDRASQGTTIAAAAPSALTDYIETQVVDDYTVVIKFSSPRATFLQDLTRPWLMIVSPAAIEEQGQDYGQHPVGTGPYMFKK